MVMDTDEGDEEELKTSIKLKVHNEEAKTDQITNLEEFRMSFVIFNSRSLDLLVEV